VTQQVTATTTIPISSNTNTNTNPHNNVKFNESGINIITSPGSNKASSILKLQVKKASCTNISPSEIETNMKLGDK